MADQQQQPKHSERLTAMRERIIGQLTESEALDLRRAIVAIERLEQGSGFSATPNVSQKDGGPRVDVSWMGQLAQIDPELARNIGNDLLEKASLAEVESGLIKFMREQMSLELAHAQSVLLQFREYRKKPSDRPSLIKSPFSAN
jgi:hypothetical protein